SSELLSQDPYELRVDIRFKGAEQFAEYSSFRLESETNKYRLKLGSYTGNAQDALSHHKDLFFSTFDRDNDKAPASNCAISHHGGWWYNACYNANLNGQWGVKAPKGPVWLWAKGKEGVSFSEMKIRRVRSPVSA
ncbi:fibrinogen related protein 12.1, partial [Plakobranchus ocellatus]